MTYTNDIHGQRPPRLGQDSASGPLRERGLPVPELLNAELIEIVEAYTSNSPLLPIGHELTTRCYPSILH